MKQIFIDIGVTLCSMLAVAILTFIARIVHEKLEIVKQKTKSEAVKALLEKIDYIVRICVEATNQILVNDLKDADNFDDEAKKEAYQLTFKDIENLLTDEDKEQIAKNIGDIPTFIKASIETYIKDSKNNSDQDL